MITSVRNFDRCKLHIVISLRSMLSELYVKIVMVAGLSIIFSVA